MSQHHEEPHDSDPFDDLPPHNFDIRYVLEPTPETIKEFDGLVDTIPLWEPGSSNTFRRIGLTGPDNKSLLHGHRVIGAVEQPADQPVVVLELAGYGDTDYAYTQFPNGTRRLFVRDRTQPEVPRQPEAIQIYGDAENWPSPAELADADYMAAPASEHDLAQAEAPQFGLDTPSDGSLADFTAAIRDFLKTVPEP